MLLRPQLFENSSSILEILYKKSFFGLPRALPDTFRPNCPLNPFISFAMPFKSDGKSVQVYHWPVSVLLFTFMFSMAEVAFQCNSLMSTTGEWGGVLELARSMWEAKQGNWLYSYVGILIVLLIPEHGKWIAAACLTRWWSSQYQSALM